MMPAKTVKPAPAPAPAASLDDLRDSTAQLRAWRMAIDTRDVEETAEKVFQRARALAKGNNGPIPRHNEETRR